MKKTDYEKMHTVAVGVINLATSMAARFPVTQYEKSELNRFAKQLAALGRKDKKVALRTEKQQILPFVERCTGCVYLDGCEKAEKCQGFVYIKVDK